MIAGWVNQAHLWWINWVGVTVFTICIVGYLSAVFFMKKDGKRETTIMGDNFTNNGVNNGHMGHVINNIHRPPPFQLNADHLKQLSDALPKSQPVHVVPVGNVQPVSEADAIFDYLVTQGYNVTKDIHHYAVFPAPINAINVLMGEDDLVTIQVCPEAYRG